MDYLLDYRDKLNIFINKIKKNKQRSRKKIFWEIFFQAQSR